MAAVSRRDVFYALSDPTRREIIDLITEKSLNVNEIAENFEMSRSAISQHVKILIESGVVEVSQFGRERFCEVRQEKFDEITSWLQDQRKVWQSRFGKLEKHLKKLENPKQPPPKDERKR
jgi:DNA-binding transcriptional ArsR family regulator